MRRAVEQLDRALDVRDIHPKPKTLRSLSEGRTTFRGSGKPVPREFVQRLAQAEPALATQ